MSEIGSGTKGHILMVDDSKVLRHMVTKILTKNGYRVTEAKNGHDAFTALRKAKATQERIDLILLDVMMPEMGGVEFLEKRVTKDSTKDIPIIMLTTQGNRQVVVKCIKLGVKNYVLKPFKHDHLISAVEKVLAKQDAEEEEPAAAGDGGDDGDGAAESGTDGASAGDGDGSDAEAAPEAAEGAEASAGGEGEAGNSEAGDSEPPVEQAEPAKDEPA